MDTQIMLEHFRIAELSLKGNTFDKDALLNDVVSMPFSYVPSFNEEYPTSFAIIFDITLENHEKTFVLKVKAIAQFETDKPIDEEFKYSPFLIITAPAIAYPYLRAFISNLLLNCGYEPRWLPTLNFVAMAEDKEKKEEK